MKPLNILLADDAPSVGQFVSAYLQDAGHSVTYVQSGEAAVAAYRSQPFDLVLMDVVMPGIGGLEAVKQIKAIPATKWVPVIVITALGEEDDIMGAFLAGADDYFLKPINPLTLDIRIRSMMRIAAIQRSAAAIVDNVIEGIIQIDRRGRIRRFNDAAERIFGYARDEVLGKNVNMLMPSPYREAHDEYIANYVATGVAKVIGMGRQVAGLRKNGETFPMHLGVTEANTPDEKFFIGLVRDMSVEERMRSEIEFLARHDPLTGLPNRRECWRMLEERFAICSAAHGPADCSLFYCDLDGFKQVNDQCGHAAGDLVLKEACRRIRETLFVRDFIARVGGDEFIVVVDGLLNDAMAGELARRMVENVAPPIDTPAGSCRVGLSVGVAHARNHPESVEALVNAADAAMYLAKRGGKGQYALA